MSANGRVAHANGLGDAVGEVANHARRILRLERELAVAELSAKATTLKPAIVLGAGAAVLALVGAGMAAATAAAVLALWLPWWASLLIVTGGLLALAGLFAVVALARVRAAAPLVPETTIEETRRTVDTVAERLG
jgi:hypothetical protein